MTQREMPNTGPAIEVGTEEDKAVSKRKITLEIGDQGVNMDLSHEFAVYEVYGLLLMSILDIYTKHTLAPALGQMAAGPSPVEPTASTVEEIKDSLKDLPWQNETGDAGGNAVLQSILKEIQNLNKK